MNKEKDTEEYERCVMCGALTGVLKSTPIELREDYVVGCGQICLACRRNLYNFQEEENKRIRAAIMHINT